MTNHLPQLADEIGQAYMNTMRWYYLTHFSRYRQALEKLSLSSVDKQDSLGADQTSQKSMIHPNSP
jgi:vacuolar protein sorting-associated protein 52